MRRVLIYMVAAGVLFFSCNKGAEPDEVANKFFKAIEEKNFHAAKTYATNRTDKWVEVMKSLSSMAPKDEEGLKYEVLGCKVQGDKALVEYRSNKNNSTETLTLIKKNDHWLVGAME